MSTSVAKLFVWVIGPIGALCAFVHPSQCVAQPCLAHTYAFGDSLTQNDEVHYLFLNRSYRDYGADPVEGMFKQLSKPGDQLHCCARLAASSDAVLRQVQKYDKARRKGKIPAGTFFSLQAGANNLFATENQTCLAASAPGKNADADAIVNRIVCHINKGAEILKETKGAMIVVWTVPDITLTPMILNDLQALGLDKVQLQNIRLHVKRLNAEVKKLGEDKRIVVLDTHAIFNSVVVGKALTQLCRASGPPLSKLATIAPVNVRTGCCFAALSGLSRQTAQAKKPLEIFVDPIHPSAEVNSLVTRRLLVSLKRMQYSQKSSARPAPEMLADAE